MHDLISRQDALDEWNRLSERGRTEFDQVLMMLPSAQPEPEIKPIEYRDCANAMLMMWMDNVVTDGEYSRIMDKLNAHEIEGINYE